MCDRPGNCSGDETCQLVLKNERTGMETTEYYCKAHLVLRILEVESTESLDVIDATKLWR